MKPMTMIAKLEDAYETCSSVNEVLERMGLTAAHARIKGDSASPDEETRATWNDQYDAAIETCTSVEEVIERLGMTVDHAMVRQLEPEYAAAFEAIIQRTLDRGHPNWP